MSAAPSPTRLTREDLPGAPEWVERLLLAVNPFMEATADGLTNALTFGDNHAAQVTTIDVAGPSRTWTAPTFLNSWVNFGSGYTEAAYSIDATGTVYIRGLVKSGTVPADVFVLPVGYRPATNIVLSCASGGNAFGTLRIGASASAAFTPGAVNAASAGTNAYLSLENISFQAVGTCAAPVRPTGPGWPAPIKTTLPVVSWVQLVRCLDLDATTNAITTTAAGAVPEWRMGGNGQVQILHVPGLSPGRRYRMTFLLLAG